MTTTIAPRDTWLPSRDGRLQICLISGRHGVEVHARTGPGAPSVAALGRTFLYDSQARAYANRLWSQW